MIGQNYRKGKSRKHRRLLPSQAKKGGERPTNVRYYTSSQIMAATKDSFIGPAQVKVRTARRLAGYVHTGPSKWWPHQNTREMERRQKQAQMARRWF
jgi:hypothetical protein